MHVRAATPTDLPAIVRRSGQLFAEDGGTRDAHTDTGWPQREGLPYFTAALGNGDVRLLVAERDGAVRGHLLGRRAHANPTRPGVVVAELESMYVDPGHRGHGVGAALVAAFRGWAVGIGADLASVTAFAANARARRFYVHMGFVEHTVTLEADLRR